MKNVMFNVKKFLANKNTVTILGVFLGLLVLYIGYNFRVQQAIQPVRVPYALTDIQPREKITAEMIGYVNVPPAMLMGTAIIDANIIIGQYANYNTVIPEGSLFYENTLIDKAEFPDSAFMNIPKDNAPFSLPVDIESTYGNSIFPGNYINIYLKAVDSDGKIMIGQLLENVKVLAVKDSSGRHVFEDTEEGRTSSYIIFAVPEDIHLLLRKAYYLGTTTVSTELIPVPNTISYTGEVGTIKVTNQFLKTYIETQTVLVPEDELPELVDETDNNEDTETPDEVTEEEIQE